MKIAQSQSDRPSASSSASSSNKLLPYFRTAWNFPALDYLPIRAVAAILILGLCAIRAYVGLWGMRVYTHDAFSLLDGAWRIMNGQRPHIDFYTGLGPVSYLVTAGGVIIAAGNAAGLAYGQALFGCLAGLWAYRLSERRMGGLATIAMSAIVVLTAIVPTTIGDASTWITPGMTYNRFGYALVALLMIESSCACQPERPGDESWGGVSESWGGVSESWGGVSESWGGVSESWGGASTGLLLGLLLFLKVSYFLGAGFLLVALVPLKKQTRARWYGMAAAFAVVALAFAWYLRFDLPAVYNDLRIVAHAKQVTLGEYVVKDLLVSAVPFLFFAQLVAQSGASRGERNAMRIAGLAVCVTGLFLLITSWQFFGLPLNCVMAILLVDRVVAKTGGSQPLPAPRFLVLLFGCFFAFTYIVSEASGLNYAWRQKFHPAEYTTFTTPQLAGFNTPVEGDYFEYVKEGYGLLNQHRQARDTVTSLDFTNPFSFGLGMKPPAGGATWLQYGTNFDDAGPSPQRIFGDASLVMLPKLFSDKTLADSVPRLYGPYLKQHYALEAESLNWWLYRRREVMVNGLNGAWRKASAAANR